ncbi:MAG: Ubiquitin-conjugating enzyme E2 4 [Marteilia pararefringens]
MMEHSEIFSIFQPDTDNLFEWKCVLKGQDETPYCGGKFVLSISVPHDYPFKPPVIRFLTKIFHPNISTDGTICLDILNTKWSPALTIPKTVLSVMSLMSDPNAEDPLNSECATIFKKDRAKYFEKCVEYTHKYAMDTSSPVV